MQESPQTLQELLRKVEELKKTGKVDLSMEEDLSVAVMNLVSLEEHFFFTGIKTEKEKYFDFLQEVREIRKKLLVKLVPQHEGETWCVSKHLLATVMRLIEVGTKLRADGKQNEAKEVFEHAHKLYSLFWAVRLRLIDLTGLKEVAKEQRPWTLKDILDKLVNCCEE